MPTFLQLPNATAASAGDLLPIDQQVAGVWTTGKVTLSALTTYFAAAIGTVSYSVSGLPVVSTAGSSDLVGISQGGADKAVSLGALLNGETIDAGASAGAASDSDRLWVGQGGSAMSVQTFGAVWTWVLGHLPTYKRRVVELSVNTQLDGSAHNDALLICSQPITISPAFITQGSGFRCFIVNMSSGAVTLAAGIATSNGGNTIPVGQTANVSAFSYSAGSVVFAEISGTASLAAPGQMTALAAGTVTSTTIALTWTAPATGGAAATYQVQYQAHGSGTWLNGPAVPATATTGTVTGLTPATAYDFQVAAVNAAGTGTYSAILASVSTAAGSVNPPNVPTGLAVSGTPTASAITMQWTAPATDGTHDAATGYELRWSPTGADIWTTVTSGTTSAAVSGLTSAVGYDFQVRATNGSSSSPSAYTATVTVNTAVAPPNLPTGVTVGSATGSSLVVNWTAPATDASHSAATGYQVQYRTTAGPGAWSAPAVVSGGSTVSTTISGLTGGTSYDFEVQATNAGPTPSGWTAPVSASTNAAGNYLLTAGYLPSSGATFTVSQGGIGGNVNDNSTVSDGSHTVPASVAFYWSLSNSVVPTTGAMAASIFDQDTHQYWAAYLVAPAVAGNYYLWAVAKDSGANVVATWHSPSAFTVS